MKKTPSEKSQHVTGKNRLKKRLLPKAKKQFANKKELEAYNESHIGREQEKPVKNYDGSDYEDINDPDFDPTRKEDINAGLLERAENALSTWKKKYNNSKRGTPEHALAFKRVKEFEEVIENAKSGKMAKGGKLGTMYGRGLMSYDKRDYNVNVDLKNLEVDVNITRGDSVNQNALTESGAEWYQEQWGYLIQPENMDELFSVLEALKVNFTKKELNDAIKTYAPSSGSMAKGGKAERVVKPYHLQAGNRYKYLHGKGTVEYLAPSQFTKGDYLFRGMDGKALVISEDELSTSISEIKEKGGYMEKGDSTSTVMTDVDIRLLPEIKKISHDYFGNDRPYELIVKTMSNPRAISRKEALQVGRFAEILQAKAGKLNNSKVAGWFADFKSELLLDDKFKKGGDIMTKQQYEMVNGYKSAILFSEVDENEEPLDKNYSDMDFAEATDKAIDEMIEKYRAENKEAIDASGLENDVIGMDIWYAQAGHGAGFFDHNLDKDVEDKLTKSAKALARFPEIEIDDNKEIHVRGVEKYEEGGSMAKGGRTNPTISTIHQAIERKEPSNYGELIDVVHKYLPKTFGWNANNVYFMGNYQGVRLFIFDSKQKEHQLPSKTETYSMKEDKNLPAIYVDETGKEIKGGSMAKGGKSHSHHESRIPTTNSETNFYDLRVGLGNESLDEKISRAIRDLFSKNNGEIDKQKMDKTIATLSKNTPQYKKSWDSYVTTFEIKEKDGKYVNEFVLAKGGKLNGGWKLISDSGDQKYYVRDFGSVEVDDKKIPLVLVVQLYDLISSGAINESDLEDKSKPVHVYANILPKLRFISKKIKEDAEESGTGADYQGIVDYMGGVPLNIDEFTYQFENIKNAEFYWTKSEQIQNKLDGYTIMIGFLMDKSVNRLGNTGWDILNYTLGKTDKMFGKGGKAGSDEIVPYVVKGKRMGHWELIHTLDRKPKKGDAEKHRNAYNESLNKGGANEHLGANYRVTDAKIINQKTGEEVDFYKAPMFEAFEEGGLMEKGKRAGESKYWVRYVDESDKIFSYLKWKDFFTDNKEEAYKQARKIIRGYSKISELGKKGYQTFAWYIDGTPTYEMDFHDTLPVKYKMEVGGSMAKGGKTDEEFKIGDNVSMPFNLNTFMNSYLRGINSISDEVKKTSRLKGVVSKINPDTIEIKITYKDNDGIRKEAIVKSYKKSVLKLSKLDKKSSYGGSMATGGKIEDLKEGDKVIIISKQARRYNQIGKVDSIDTKWRNVHVRFPDQPKDIPKNKIEFFNENEIVSFENFKQGGSIATGGETKKGAATTKSGYTMAKGGKAGKKILKTKVAVKATTPKAPVKKRLKKSDKEWDEIALTELREHEGDDNIEKDRDIDNDGFEATSGSTSWLVFKNVDDAEQQAIDRVKDDLENNPEMFTQDWLNSFLSVSDTDRRVIANEEADNYVENIEDEDGGKRVLEEAGMESEYEAEEDEEKKDKIFEEAKEKIHDDYYETWYNGLKDPVDFLVNEQGIYSTEDLLKQSFISIDIDEAAQDAVSTDGIGHFLGTYSGDQIDLPSGAVAYKN